MTMAFVGLLLGVLAVSFVGIMSARAAARRQAARMITSIKNSQRSLYTANANEDNRNPMKLAEVGAEQDNKSARGTRDKMASVGTN